MLLRSGEWSLKFSGGNFRILTFVHITSCIQIKLATLTRQQQLTNYTQDISKNVWASHLTTEIFSCHDRKNFQQLLPCFPFD